MANLVPERECGACSACCEVPLVDDPQLAKLPGVMCSNYRRDCGCSIYETRSRTCRNWFCGWRFLENLDDAWRPDRSKVLIMPMSPTDPGRLDEGMQFDLIGGFEVVFWEPFVMAISLLIESQIPVYISIPRAFGCHRVRAHLNVNVALRAAIANNDFAAISVALLGAIQSCIDRPNVKVEFKNQVACG